MVGDQGLDALGKRLTALERALGRCEECLEELRGEMIRQVREVDERFARAQEAVRSIGRHGQDSE